MNEVILFLAFAAFVIAVSAASGISVVTPVLKFLSDYGKSVTILAFFVIFLAFLTHYS